MCKCDICGCETAKKRTRCIGCTNTIEAVRKKDQASDTNKRIAEKHLTKNPGLNVLPWYAFKKKKKSIA